uniref:Putative LOC101056226 [Mus musculus] n=1 Tax=Lepeophtheirus salmonis TaxID=72036 RepID=A0A0K2VG34_LEPSM
MWWPLEGPVCKTGFSHTTLSLGTFTTDTASKLDVLGHNSDTLSVDGTQVGIFKKTHKICLRSLLESHDGRGLETQVSLEILSNLSNQTLKGQFSDEELSRLLVSTDFT